MHPSRRLAAAVVVLTLAGATTVVAAGLGTAGTSAKVDTQAQTPTHPIRPPAPRPPVHPSRPHVRVVNVVFNAGADVGRAQADVNACQGPTAVQWGPTPPMIIQHNYCGGWGLVDVHPGEQVRIRGAGAVDGLYRWASVNITSGAGPITDIKRSWGDVVLQTCLNQTQLKLVGLVRVGPTDT